MTTLQTSFELSPAGTAIPTSGVAGDGDAFSAGNDGTATFVSDSTTTGAIASGSFCGKMTIGATASVCHRTWNLSTSTPSVRMYLYLTAYPNTTWDLASPVSGGTLLSRVRMSNTGALYITLAGTNQVNSTGVIPLNTLVRIEADWSLSTTAGTCSVDAYSGHSTTPLANLSISASGMAMASATCSSFRVGTLATGPTSFTSYTDGWGVSDTGRLGPIATPATVVGGTAAVRVRSAAGAAGAVQLVGGVTAVIRALAAAGVATGGSGVAADWVGTDPWNPADPWPGPHGGATLGATAVIWVRAVGGIVVSTGSSSPVPPPEPIGHEWLLFSRTTGYGLDELLPIASLTVVRRHMGVSRAVATTAFTPARWESLQAGRGLVAFRDSVQEFTGLVTAREHTWDAESGRMVINVEAEGDERHLAKGLVFPDPLRAPDDQTVNDYWKTRDTAGNAVARRASTAMVTLISDQAGPTCRADRRVPGLVIGDDPGVGVSRVWSGLFDASGEDGVLSLLAAMSVASGQNLGLRITSAAGVLTASVVAPRDLASAVRFSVDLSNLVGYTYREEAPTATDAVAAGQGDLHLRLRRYAQTASVFAQSWGVRIWRYVDRRDTADLAELDEAAADALTDGDATVNLTVRLTDSQAATYRTDWDLGDKVTVYVAPPGFDPIATVADVIREVMLEVDQNGAETVTPAIGTFDAKAVIPTPTQKSLSRIGQALGGLIARK